MCLLRDFFLSLSLVCKIESKEICYVPLFFVVLIEVTSFAAQLTEPASVPVSLPPTASLTIGTSFLFWFSHFHGVLINMLWSYCSFSSLYIWFVRFYACMLFEWMHICRHELLYVCIRMSGCIYAGRHICIHELMYV